ncbi:coiled-coil domain-containing protein 39-like [Senna tora]|uniref:Coiled-coil domain-containing protein 39-like n=1 Tax=Senna tora TaxID=362788 RepID=A0A834XAG5_9FABA|nr:coiled-coil domain-containing protein 39-like [Senna tora]
MGSSQSSNRRISDSKTVTLLQNQFMETDYAVQEYLKLLQGLKKEIGSLKSILCSLETEIHTTKPIYELGSTSKTKGTEVYEQEAITNVEKKVEKLEKNLDDVILGREAQKIIHSA